MQEEKKEIENTQEIKEAKKDVSSQKVNDFENVFVVTEEKCEEWGLPPTSFILSYPSNDNLGITFPENLDEGYIEIIKKSNEINKNLEILEIVKLEYTGALDQLDEIENEEARKEVLEMIDMVNQQMVDQIEQQVSSQYPPPLSKIHFKGKKSFFGEEVYQAWVEFKKDGDWYKSVFIFLPRKGKSKNGAFLIFQAHEDNPDIRKFEDFGKKGITGKIWQTFRFNE